MNKDQYKAMIVGAVSNPDPAQLDSLASHMADCEEANSILRAKGWGIQALIQDWEQRSRQQFLCAQRTEDPMGRRVMEHGAFVYFNCANELRAKSQISEVFQPSPTPK